MPIEIHDPINTRPQPRRYILEPALQKAVEVALMFNQPLLLTGEPGTGKTLLAYKVAEELHSQTQNGAQGFHFAAEPLRFNTKTSSIARDLFYTYDAIGHFQNANIKREQEQGIQETAAFIELQALGKAIALANPITEYKQYFRWKAPEQAQSSVVLIDEIDKAPRDFTNDILNEIEEYEFFIKEQDNYPLRMTEDNQQRILVIMTSNSEKNLPDAFLRRCVFYHIPFPNKHRLMEIMKAQLSVEESDNLNTNLSAITDLFEKIRKAAVRKPPATAELVAFVKMLEMDGLLDTQSTDQKQWYIDNLSLLIKTKDDIKAVTEAFEIYNNYKREASKACLTEEFCLAKIFLARFFIDWKK